MNQLTWRLVLPLTVISFATFTKWWYVLPVDAPDTMMAGFPLPFVSDGWHTSMSLQIFLAEFIIDFLIYFLFWFLLIFFIDHYLARVKIHRLLTWTLWTLSTLIFTIAILIASMPDQIIRVKRDWDMQVIETGYKLIWKHQEGQNLKNTTKGNNRAMVNNYWKLSICDHSLPRLCGGRGPERSRRTGFMLLGHTVQDFPLSHIHLHLT